MWKNVKRLGSGSNRNGSEQELSPRRHIASESFLGVEGKKTWVGRAVSYLLVSFKEQGEKEIKMGEGRKGLKWREEEGEEKWSSEVQKTRKRREEAWQGWVKGTRTPMYLCGIALAYCLLENDKGKPQLVTTSHWKWGLVINKIKINNLTRNYKLFPKNIEKLDFLCAIDRNVTFYSQ